MAYIRARVSDESFAGWRSFAHEHGVSVSALVEALGPTLGQRAVVPDGKLTTFGSDVVRRARDVDEQRRRRR